MKPNRRQGFTLLELLVVVIVIGILASVALPQFGKMIKKSRVAEAKNMVGAILTAELVHYQENGIFTSDDSALLVDIPAKGATNSNFDYAAGQIGGVIAETTATGRGPAKGIVVIGTLQKDGTRIIGDNL